MSFLFILGGKRTPIGSFKGSLSSKSACELGAIAIKSALEITKVIKVDQVIMGNVCGANLGQAPARQAALGAGLSTNTPCTTINKVCASGMKSIMLGASSILAGDAKIVVAGGMESMSNVPFYSKRDSLGYGHQQIYDGIIRDGLWDVYNNVHMGTCAENTAKKHGIGREMQDKHASESYYRATSAWKSGLFANEVTPVEITGRKGPVTVSVDEEYQKVKYEKIPSLKPAFINSGTITAANASKLNDGAVALILAHESVAGNYANPLGRIVSYADAACDPIDFPIAPALAIPIALQKAGLAIKDIALWEINEAFSVVVCANEKILGLDRGKVNVRGGAVSLGHPIGASGARIVLTLLHSLKKGEKGVAAICNGGGGASAVVVERV